MLLENEVIKAYASFQFLGIPPKGELPLAALGALCSHGWFPISRDPPEGGTAAGRPWSFVLPRVVSNF